MILIALRVLRAGLLLGIPVTAILLLRTAPQPVAPAEGAAAARGEAARAEARRPLDWYAPLWERDLRQPPIPPAPVEVRPGPVMGDHTLIEDGLAIGDTVVVEGAFALKAQLLKAQLGEGHGH